MSQPEQHSRRACDSCRIRKVRCDHQEPRCSQCAHFNLPCVTATRRNSRRKPIRGRLVAQARGDDDLSHWETGPQPFNPPSPLLSLGQNQLPSAFARSLDRGIEVAQLRNLLPQFEMLVYPFTPILSPTDVHEAIDNMADSLEDTAFVYAFAAVTTFLVQEKSTPSKDVRDKTEQLIQRSLEAHRSISFQVGLDGRIVEGPRVTIKRILTCMFLEISMMAFERFDSSFFILREAISMIQIFQVRGLPNAGPVLAQYQRLYWEAYIHERFLTFNSGFPNVLPPLSTGLPESDTLVPRHIQIGFNRIISLFMLLDEDFLRFWRRQAEPQGESDLTAEWVEYKQNQLDEDEMSTFEEDERLRKQGLQGLNEFQHADIYITRLWIRTLVWQLALSQGLLRSLPPQDDHTGLSLQYPARQISAQLRNLVGRVENLASITMQGSGIAHKLFDITSTIADVLTVCYTREYEREACFQLNDLEFLVNFLSQFEQLRQNQMDYLREKLQDFGKGPAA